MTPVKLALLTVLDETHADAVIEHRRVTIKKPLTKLAAELLAKRFAEYGDANAAVEIMIERCWQGFNVGWLAKGGLAISRPAKPRTSSMADYTGHMLEMFDERARSH